MPEERRYGDEEVTAIFASAATAAPAPHPPAPAAAGLTLADLQSIGREVGMDPARIALAAAELDGRPAVVPRRTLLGMPTSVGRIVTLPRAPTDREWAILVADLRETFAARGADRSDGSVRQWAQGNLHAFVEPSDAGERLRLRTTKGDAAVFTALGLAMLALALVMAVVLTLTGEIGADPLRTVLPALLGAGTLGANAVRLRRWAGEREAQMEAVAARAVTMLAAPATDEVGPRFDAAGVRLPSRAT